MIMHHIQWQIQRQKNFWDRLHWPRSKTILSEQCLSHGQGQIQFWHLTLLHWTLQIVRTLSFCLSQDLSQLWQIHHQEFVTEKKRIMNYCTRWHKLCPCALSVVFIGTFYPWIKWFYPWKKWFYPWIKWFYPWIKSDR